MSQIDDLAIRKVLISSQISTRNFSSEYRVIEELDLCQGAARIDIAIINGSTWGIEIKGETDNLRRLSNQIQVYNKVFDYIEIACTSNHLKAVSNMIPKHWGILSVTQTESEISCSQLRQPSKNKLKEKTAVVQLLWKCESLKFLDSFYSSKGFNSKNRSAIWSRIVELSEDSEFYDYVNNCLRNRQDWRFVRSLL